MKQRVFFFLATVLVALAIPPIFNLLSAGGVPRIPLVGQNPQHWWNRAFLYNLDFASTWLSRCLYPLGISMDPDQVIVGRAGWLYLGDKHNSTRSVARRGQTPNDVAMGQRIGVAAAAWDNWLRSKGVRLYSVMVGPNKGSIYPAPLPDWATPPAKPSATDALMDGVGHDLYVDLRQALVEGSKLYPQALFYKTDTHWNSLGAALGFQAFGQHVTELEPTLRWPMEQGVQVLSVARRPGGDLARFLRLASDLSDPDPLVQPFPDHPVQFVTELLARGAVSATDTPKSGIGAPPVRVTSERALNAKRVLWLRDSFGDALVPFMAATFSESVQLHWSDALADGGRRFVDLVESWKPEYVFVTVVERDARSELFTVLPPPIADRSGFSTRRGSAVQAVHDLVAGKSQGKWRIVGNDPFVDYALAAPILARDAPLLAFDLTCDGSTAPVALQIFWRKSGDPHFTESSSKRLNVNPGTVVVDLAQAPGWRSVDELARVRIDIDSSTTCPSFNLSNVELGATAPRGP